MDRLSPYKGLASFEDSDVDARFFFGRAREQEIITANLTAARLTLLYGSSGVGKSSVLRAGVVRRLRTLAGPLAVVVFDRWRDEPGPRLRETVAAVGGDEPQGSLADTLEAACARLGGEIYVILDAAEEYFVYHRTESEPGTFAADFPSAVQRPGLRAYFLLSLREDALAELDRFKPAIPSLFANSLRLDHLDRPAAREAIVGPIDRYNETAPDDDRVAIEPELVDAVLDQVASGKVDLGRAGRGVVDGGAAASRVETPFLSLVMERLWDAERAAGSSRLRLRTLDELGGAEQIVKDHLGDALETLPPASQAAAAEIFNHLVTPSGAKIAHSVSDLAEYAGAPTAELEPVLQALASERILRPVGGTDESTRYEIFHDVLAQPALTWRAQHQTEREVERKVAEEHRRRRRLQRLFALVLVALGLMVGVTIFALSQRSEARSRGAEARLRADEARAALRQARVAKLEALAGSQFEIDPELSLRSARDAVRLARTPESEELLRAALARSHIRSVARLGEPLVAAVAHNRNLLSVTSSGVLVATDRKTGRTGRTGTGVKARAASFADDGSALIIGSDGRARIVRAGRSATTMPDLSGITGGELSRDGKLAVIFNHDSTMLVDVATGGIRGPLLRPDTGAASISRDGSRIATVEGHRNVRVWDGRSPTPIVDVADRFGQIVAVALSPTGDLVAAADTEGIAEVWRVADGVQVALLTGHGNALTDVDFSPNGREIATASRDKTIRVWNVTTNFDRIVLLGHTQRVTSARFGGRGFTIVSTSLDGTTRLWNVRIPELQVLANVRAPVTGVEYRRHGREVLAMTQDARVHLLDPSTGTKLRTRSAPERLRPLITRRGANLELRGDGFVVRLRGQSELLEKRRLTSAELSPDSRFLVTTDNESDPRIWVVRSGALHRILTGHVGRVEDASFSPDGRWIVTAGTKAGIWNVQTGKRLTFVRGSGDQLTSATFDPTGRTILTGGVDGTVRTYRCELCGNLDRLLELADNRLAATKP